MKQLFLIVLFSTITTYAQVGIGTTNPDNSAQLDITATNKGLLIPRVSLLNINNTSPITTPAQGLLVYNTNSSIGSGNGIGFYYFEGTSWKKLSTSVNTNNTLNQAYNEGGLGSGRIITANNGDVQIKGSFGLTVKNNIKVGYSIFHDGDNGNNIAFTPDNMKLSAGYKNYVEINNTNKEIIFNETGALQDFRIEVPTNPHLFFVDASSKKIGIKNPTPDAELDVNGTIDVVDNAGATINIGGVNFNEDTISVSRTTSTSGSVINAELTTTNSAGTRSVIKTYNNLSKINVDINRNDAGGKYYGAKITKNNLASISTSGLEIDLSTNGFAAHNATHYGIRTNLRYNNGLGTIYGHKINILGTGNAVKYGLYTKISESAGGIHYGVFSDVRKNTGFAGYFIGRTSFGASTSRYIMPLADGTANQVMATNGLGQVNFVDSSTFGTDTQNTLDQAYDEGGAGAGKTITADNGAVDIAGADGFQVTGTQGSGATIALSGAGTRMFFNPRKAAFRAGKVLGVPYDQYWDNTQVGDYSFASGLNTLAQGEASVSMGHYNKSLGFYSTSFGSYAFAIGDMSVALGNYAKAEGWSSFATGNHSFAKAPSSAVFGTKNNTNGFSSTVVGMYNDAIVTVQNAVTNTTPLFIVGNGNDNATRSNALTIYKNGKMNINDAYDMPLTDGTANQIMKTNGAGVVSFVNPNTIFTDSNTQNTLDQAYDEGGLGAGRAINTTHGAVLLNGNDGLEVRGASAGISISNTTENESGIHFRDSGNTSQYADINYDNSNSNNSLNLYVNSATALMTLDDNQRVGIGTTSPSQKLSVTGTANLNEGITQGVALRVNGTEALWFNGSRFSWGFGGTENYFADKVGIGTNSSIYKLDVADTQNTNYVAQIYNKSTNLNADGLRIRLKATNPNTANYFIGFYNGSNVQRGRITGNGTGVTYNTASDRRLKTNIVDINNALQIINKIQPRKYEFKANLGVEEYGFIAQELQIVYPQVVSGNSNGNVKTDPMMVDYGRLTPILAAGIKELNNKVKKLEADNNNLKQLLAKYTSLEIRINNIENKLNTKN